MKKMIKWLESNVFSITIAVFGAGTLVAIVNVMCWEILEYISWSLFGIAAIVGIIQIIWAWIINPIRAYRKKRKKL